MTISWRSVTSLEQIAQQASYDCVEPQHDMVLAYELPLASLNDDFVQAYAEAAKEWTQETVPEHLHFTHGQHFQGETGIAHVISELERKRTSRRAVLALVGMKHLIGSGDEPRPALMLVQFGIEGQILYLTAYFRALEVACFLPINLAEFSIYAQKVASKFPETKTLRLMIVAFQAYADKQFSCLRKAELDSLPSGKVGVAVTSKKVKQIRAWLDGKRRTESFPWTARLDEMLTAAAEQENSEFYGAAFLDALRVALELLTEIRERRQRTSEVAAVEALWKRYLNAIDRALSNLPS